MKRAWQAGLLLLLATQPARAHSLSVAYLDIESRPDHTLVVELDVAVRDLALTLPLDADRDEVVTWGELVAMRAPLEALVRERLALSAAGGRCDLRPTGFAIRRYDDGAYAALAMRGRCPGNGALSVEDNLFFDRDAQHRTLVSYREGASVATVILRDTQRRATVGGDIQDSPFLTFLQEGVRHILTGYDHLAFLLSLLLPAVLVRRGDAWLPSPRLGDSVAGTTAIVTAFTLAHSLTLSLAALGWVVPAARSVEVAIAASVLLAALNNVWPVVTRRAWLIAFGFGLVHGFGFAGALSELGLPKGARLASLLGFNLGVEIGQLGVVALVLPALFALRRRGTYPRVLMPATSCGIAAIAAYWCLRRLAP